MKASTKCIIQRKAGVYKPIKADWLQPDASTLDLSFFPFMHPSGRMGAAIVEELNRLRWTWEHMLYNLISWGINCQPWQMMYETDSQVPVIISHNMMQNVKCHIVWTRLRKRQLLSVILSSDTISMRLRLHAPLEGSVIGAGGFPSICFTLGGARLFSCVEVAGGRIQSCLLRFSASILDGDCGSLLFTGQFTPEVPAGVKRTAGGLDRSQWGGCWIYSFSEALLEK